MTEHESLNTWLTIFVAILIGLWIGCECLTSYYKLQITGLRTQLSRTQKQLKRASEDRARQTKRIAELTGNGG
ncbi:hypothetical protein HK118_04600 [Streptococcus agalactiae]|nr:hypothetical protein [Streptococcus agalactiae]MCC9947976.1 hypothetical protein [Streptococcus agalactiae]